MNSESNEEPKIIIDEDYKSQVEREKAEFKEKQTNESDETDAVTAETSETRAESEGNAAGSTNTQQEIPPPPPASLEFLVTSLATQAMASMGQIPGEDGQPMPKNLDYARHFIDLIAVLEEKTKGNLTDDEDKFIQGTLHQMRMIFVQVG